MLAVPEAQKQIGQALLNLVARAAFHSLLELEHLPREQAHDLGRDDRMKGHDLEESSRLGIADQHIRVQCDDALGGRGRSEE